MPNPVESAAKKLASEMTSWRSIELRYQIDIKNHDPARPSTFAGTLHQTCRYIETAAGQRLLEERTTTDINKDTSVQIEYDEGPKCASMLRTDTGGRAGREQVTIKRHFYLENTGAACRAQPLRYLYAGLTPLHEVLTRTEYLGEGRQLGRGCDRFLLTHLKGDQDPVNTVYWLDRETGITVRLDYYENDKKRSEGRPYFTWNAESLDDVNGRRLTLKSQLLQFDVEGRDPQRVLVQCKISTDEVAFDREYPKSTFWPTITKDTSVIDSIKNTAVFPKTNAKEMPSTAAPIRAIDPAGWGFSFSNSAMLLGLAALGAGMLLWWRRG